MYTTPTAQKCEIRDVSSVYTKSRRIAVVRRDAVTATSVELACTNNFCTLTMRIAGDFYRNLFRGERETYNTNIYLTYDQIVV